MEFSRYFIFPMPLWAEAGAGKIPLPQIGNYLEMPIGRLSAVVRSLATWRFTGVGYILCSTLHEDLRRARPFFAILGVDGHQNVPVFDLPFVAFRLILRNATLSPISLT
jgi:hypothetical protein